MTLRLLLTSAAALFLASCTREPERLAPPLQRSLTPGSYAATPLLKAFLAMDDPAAREQIVGGLQGSPEGSGWRWTHERPEIRYPLDRTEGWSFAADIGFPDANFKQTGPVTVRYRINGRLLASVRYDKPGDYHFEHPVPANWLKKGEFNVFVAEIDPPWVSPSDGVKLGMVLHRAGFLQK